MTWTTPTLTSPGDVLTSARYNSDVVNNTSHLYSKRYCEVDITTTWTIPSTGWETVTGWDNEIQDPYGLHSTTTNPERISVPSDYPGLWMVWGYGEFSAVSGGTFRRAIRFTRNGTDIRYPMQVPHYDSTSEPTVVSGIAMFVAANPDYFTMQVRDNAGLHYLGSTSKFGAVWLGGS